MAKPSGLQPWGAPPTPHGYQGGDLLGVVEHLDYLADLGINAIYFNPIFRSASNHRYHTHDYYQVDPMLGGNAALRDLLDAAHARGIRVVLDGVFNHASRGFFQFHDILENGPESAYLDWFTVEDWPLRPYGSKQPNYRCWWGNPALPKFNTEHAGRARVPLGRRRATGSSSASTAGGWMCPARSTTMRSGASSAGVVKAANPEAYIVGEIWDDADAVAAGRPVRRRDELRRRRGPRSASSPAQTFDREYRPGGFTLHAAAGARHSCHEIERLMERLPLARSSRRSSTCSTATTRPVSSPRRAATATRCALALLFLMTMPGAPCIYYGTEIGMAGGPDPDCRRAFPWDEAAWDHEPVATTTRRAIALRKARPALRRGTFERFYASNDVCTFGRRAADDAVVVAFNAGPEARTFNVDVGDLLPDGTATDLWGGGTARVLHGTLRHVTLPPRRAWRVCVPVMIRLGR